MMRFTVSLALLMFAALSSAQDLGTTSLNEKPLVSLREARYLTLQQAQQVAAQADTLMARLAGLEVEAAVELRRAARADYFPKLGTGFANLHFNKFMGQEIVLNRPITGGTFSTALPLLGQDLTLLSLTAAQPITPLFKVREAVALARADENIARAKAGMPVVQRVNAVEKNYFDLLIAQKQLALAEAEVRLARTERPAAQPTFLAVSIEQSGAERDITAAVESLEKVRKQVRTLTASLNELLEWPGDTRLELEPPSPLTESLSLQAAITGALAANPDVIEAEQNVEKAEAASRLSKLDYVPDIAVIGGYIYQVDAIPLLPRDFSYIGVLGSYNLFDFGKREYTVKARSAQVRMARTALELTKEKVATAVKTTYLKLEQSRAMSEMARRGGTEAKLLDASSSGDMNVRAGEILRALELLRLDYEHRQAYAEVKAVIGQP